MSRATIRNGCVVKCDMSKCTNTFVTYSVAAKARAQAALVGWSHINGKQVTDADGHILSTNLVDLCPEHKPKALTIKMSPEVAR